MDELVDALEGYVAMTRQQEQYDVGRERNAPTYAGANLFANHNDKDQEKKPAGHNLPRPRSKRACYFCDSENHTVNYCKEVTDPKKRLQIVKSNQRCVNCLRREHDGESCPSESTCLI